MLPYLKPKKAGSIVSVVMDKAKQEPMNEEGEHPPELVMAAEQVLSAIAMKDANALADALQAAFEICDAYPHVEGEHIESESEE